MDIRNGGATVIFAYQGSGTIYQLGTPPFVWWDPLQDYYSLKAYETDDSNWVRCEHRAFLVPSGLAPKPQTTGI